MKTIIICLLAASVVFGAHETVQPAINSGLSLAEVAKYNELKETKWGKIFIGLAEVQLSGAGPIQRLLQALDDLVKELGQAQNDEITRYGNKKGTHDGNVQSINSQINEAQNEINSNKIKISSILIPRKDQATEDISRDSQLKDEKINQISTETSKRAIEKAAFEKRIGEHNDAIAAVDECLALLEGILKNKPSLLEVRKATVSIKKLEAQIRKTHVAEIPFIEALISLAMSQNFVDQEALSTVLQKLNDFRRRLGQSVQLETSNEANAVKSFGDLISQLNKEVTDLGSSIKKNTVLITETDKAIQNSNDIIFKKSIELADFKAQLEAEEDSWRQETKTHEEIIAEIVKEIEIVKQCRDLFANKQFGSFAASKIN